MGGLSFVRVTMESKNAAENILRKLFMKYRKQINDEGQVKVRMVTTNSQVPFIVSFFAKSSSGKDADMGHDIVATKVAGGSQEYMKWVREQVGSKFSGNPSASTSKTVQSLTDADSDAE